MLSVTDLGPPLLALVGVAMIVLKMSKRQEKEQAYEAVEETPEEDVQDDRIRCPCFFGSQTGTAEGFARDMADELSKKGFNAQAVDLEEVDYDDFQTLEFAMFFMATYGEGDPCDNSIEFINFLKKSSDDEGPSDDFASNLKFTVFGLGNTQYEHYNEMGHLVQKRMKAVGGTEIYELGLGDDDKDLEEDFENWREGALDTFVKEAFGMTSERKDSFCGDDEVSEDYKAVFVPKPEDPDVFRMEGRIDISDQVASKKAEDPHKVDLSSRHFYQGAKSAVLVNYELRQDTKPGSTVHVEFDLRGTGLTYKTADNLTVCPENDADQVEEALRYLRVDGKQWFRMESTKKPLFPTPCTIQAAFAYFTDLNGAPTRSLLTKLAPFVSMSEHKKRLLFLGSKEGKDDFHKYISERMLSIVDLFETFPSFKLTEDNLGAFFQVMPRLKGRDFTIASSSHRQPNEVALTVGVIKEERRGAPEGRVLRGVCSNYLQMLHPNTTALVFVKDSTFKLPDNPKTPIIMIGPGTGIAPMRAFIQERIHQRETLGLETGDSILFFGCRREDEDFLYKEELLEAVASGALTKLHTAFSRQQAEKVYVQNVMLREKEELWRLIHEEGAYIYVCGATKMGRDVNSALCEIVKADNPQEYVKDLHTQGRYIQELWSS